MAGLFKLGTGGRGRKLRSSSLRGDWCANVRLGPYRFKRARLCTDRATSERWAVLLQAAADRRTAGEPPDREALQQLPRRIVESFGLISALSKRRTGPFQDSIDDCAAELRTAGRAKAYVDNVRRCLETVSAACGWQRLADVSRDAIVDYLASQKAAGRAARTLNNTRATLSAFFAWCVDGRRLETNSCDTVKRVESSGDRRRERRAMTQDECARLLAVAGSRELVYRVALGTGLRRLELKRLEWRDVRFDDPTRPHIALRAEATKAKRADVLPLSPDMAARLRSARPDGCASTDRVFRRVPKFQTWQRDVERAGLTYRADDGSILGFHSLRVTFVTELQRAGLPPRTVMQLARHTDYRLTATTYTDMRLIDTFGAVRGLPTYDREPSVQVARRTGTDDALPGDSERDQIRDQMACQTAHRSAIPCSDDGFDTTRPACDRSRPSERKHRENKGFAIARYEKEKAGVTGLDTGLLGLEPRTF